jgi:hypothetical protein
MGFVDALKASKSDLVYLVRAKEKPSNEDAWYYVQVHTKQKLPVFLEKVKTGLNLTDYSDVLYSGWGTEPPEEIKEKIKEQFG